MVELELVRLPSLERSIALLELIELESDELEGVSLVLEEASFDESEDTASSELLEPLFSED